MQENFTGLDALAYSMLGEVRIHIVPCSWSRESNWRIISRCSVSFVVLTFSMANEVDRLRSVGEKEAETMLCVVGQSSGFVVDGW